MLSLFFFKCIVKETLVLAGTLYFLARWMLKCLRPQVIRYNYKIYKLKLQNFYVRFH